MIVAYLLNSTKEYEHGLIWMQGAIRLRGAKWCRAALESEKEIVRRAARHLPAKLSGISMVQVKTIPQARLLAPREFTTHRLAYMLDSFPDVA